MKILKIAGGILISIFFLWLIFKNIQIKKVFEVIRGANLFIIVLSFCVGLVGFAIRCYRWKIIGHKKYEKIPWLSFFKATNMGLMLNAFVPMRGGDLFQAYTLSQKENLSKSYVLSTVFLERLIDLIPPLLIIFLGSLFIALPKEITLTRLVIFVCVIGIILLILMRYGAKFARVFDRFVTSSHSQKIQNLINNFLSGIALLKDRWVMIKVIPLTIASWFFTGVATYLILKSVNINIPFFGAFLIHAITVLSVAIPSSPGALGVWEFFCLIALGIFGIKGEVAVGFALLFHFMALLPTTIFGLFFLLQNFFTTRLSTPLDKPA